MADRDGEAAWALAAEIGGEVWEVDLLQTRALESLTLNVDIRYRGSSAVGHKLKLLIHHEPVFAVRVKTAPAASLGNLSIWANTADSRQNQ